MGRRWWRAVGSAFFAAVWVVLTISAWARGKDVGIWLMGLVLWVLFGTWAAVGYLRRKNVVLDPECPDERLRFLEGRAGRFAFLTQTYLLLLAAALVRLLEIRGQAIPVRFSIVLVGIVCVGSSFFLASYCWHRYRV